MAGEKKPRKPRKTKQTKPKPPKYPEFMVEVTPRNRKQLEAELGYDIPEDVTYIVRESELNSDEFRWTIEAPSNEEQPKERYSDIERID